jgi:cytochrome c
MRRWAWTAARLLIAASAAGCGQSSSTSSGDSAAPPPPAPSAAEKAAALAALPEPYHTADLKNGEAKFALCRSCHTIVPGGANITGPNLYGVFGRKPAQVEGFNYSDALKNATFIWDLSDLDKWLADPRGFLPGTKMTFHGLKEAKDRIDVIAYLAVESGYKPPAAAAPANEAAANTAAGNTN